MSAIGRPVDRLDTLTEAHQSPQAAALSNPSARITLLTRRRIAATRIATCPSMSLPGLPAQLGITLTRRRMDNAATLSIGQKEEKRPKPLFFVVQHECRASSTDEVWPASANTVRVFQVFACEEPSCARHGVPFKGSRTGVLHHVWCALITSWLRCRYRTRSTAHHADHDSAVASTPRLMLPCAWLISLHPQAGSVSSGVAACVSISAQ